MSIEQLAPVAGRKEGSVTDNAMMLGVLRMPAECWSGDPLDVLQRRAYYVAAADALDAQAAEIARLRAQLETAQAAVTAAVNKSQWQARTNVELNALTAELDAFRALRERLK